MIVLCYDFLIFVDSIIRSPPARGRSKSSPRLRSVSPVARRGRSPSRSPPPRRDRRGSPVGNGYAASPRRDRRGSPVVNGYVLLAVPFLYFYGVKWFYTHWWLLSLVILKPNYV